MNRMFTKSSRIYNYNNNIWYFLNFLSNRIILCNLPFNKINELIFKDYETITLLGLNKFHKFYEEGANGLLKFEKYKYKEYALLYNVEIEINIQRLII